MYKFQNNRQRQYTKYFRKDKHCVDRNMLTTISFPIISKSQMGDKALYTLHGGCTGILNKFVSLAVIKKTSKAIYEFMRNEVILVDEYDNAKGTIDKLEAHRKALLHRAVSVFIINSKGEWILQQRAMSKYHSAGLWSNTCCTHPSLHESIAEAASKRLIEEMGMTCIPLHKAFHFIYRADLDSGLSEHEFDHVFYGFCDEEPHINHNEVMAWKAIEPWQLEKDLLDKPENYTVWFRMLFPRMKAYLDNHSL